MSWHSPLSTGDTYGTLVSSFVSSLVGALFPSSQRTMDGVGVVGAVVDTFGWLQRQPLRVVLQWGPVWTAQFASRAWDAQHPPTCIPKTTVGCQGQPH